MKHVYHRQHGFTIVELMISTVVFSIILLICLSAIMQVGGMYYKGVNTARAQQTARSIMDEISQSIQFSGSPIKPTTGTEVRYGDAPLNTFAFFCVGTKRYTYAIDAQVSNVNDVPNKKILHGLWADQPFGGCENNATITYADLTQAVPKSNAADQNGREFLDINTRLTNLSVTQSGTTGLWTVNISLNYGDEELLQALPGAAGTRGGGRRECLSKPGSQFCAIAELTTTIIRRVK